MVGSTAAAQGRDYESRLVDRVLTELGATVDSSPEGKIIRRIVIRNHEIILPEDPYPQLMNLVHVTTRESVVRRELLFSEGQRYDPTVVEETERNLRQMSILATARVVPLQAGEPGAVDLLVVTRDLWSIRFNSSYNLVGSLLQYLRIRPTEQNLFGRDKRLSLDFELRLDTLAFGQVYVDRRILGTRLALQETANLIFNRATGNLEGSEGAVIFGRPLFATTTEWGFELAASWQVRRSRLYRGAEVWELPVPEGGTVPHSYDTRELDVSGYYTRSLNLSGLKLDLSPGVGGFVHDYLPPPGLTEPQLRTLREEALPFSERALYVAFDVRAYQPEFRVLRDLMSFALSEDYQVGPLLRANVRFANPAGDTFVEGWASARERLVLGDSLTSLQVAGSIRYVPSGGTAGQAWVNRHVAFDLLHVTPFIGPGRFAARAMFEVRAEDLANTTLLLGGGNGLRGAAAESLSGTRVALWNFEYRTRPVELYTLHLGGVVFWDAGTAWQEGGPPPLTHTLGLGVRALFPQFDVEPVRIDFGWVLPGGGPSPIERFSSSFGQVTRYRPKVLDQPFE